MAALGCFAGLGVVSIDEVINAVPHSRFREENVRAVREGYELIKKLVSH